MTRALVIGGGILGLLTARELCMAGAKVTLVEKGETARESSWAGGGILSPLYPWRYSDAVTRLARVSQAAYPELAEQLRLDTGIDPELVRNGMLIFEKDELDRGLDWARHWDVPAERIDHLAAPLAIRELEPELEPPASDALWFPDIAQVRNPRLTRALRADIERRGVTLRTQTAVTAIRFDDGRAVGVQTPGGEIAADIIVVCAGAWTAELLNGAGGAAPDIAPVRGQMILFHTEPELIRHMTLAEGRYAIPRLDGRVLFGSTLEHSGFDKTTTAAAREELYLKAIELYPVLRRYPIEHHWAGLRPGSPRGIPYIGQHPRADNLFLNAGHYRNGVVLGLASARLLTDLVLNRPPILDPTPYVLTAPRSE